MRHFRSSNFRQVTDNWELTVKIFTLNGERIMEEQQVLLGIFQRLLKSSEKFVVYVCFVI